MSKFRRFTNRFFFRSGADLSNTHVAFKVEDHSGDSARHESTDTSSAEYAACVKRLEDYVTGLVISQTEGTPQERYRWIKTTAARLLEECKRFEEGKPRRETKDGSTPENAKQEKITAARVARASVPGLQLCFELYCMQCHFQCWECPECNLIRCACAHLSCGCLLDGNRKPSDSKSG